MSSIVYREPVNYTCPDIDKVINILESAREGFADDSDFDLACDLMEELRTANAKLRDWGSEMSEEVGNLENKLSELENDIEYLQTEKDDLSGYVEELESKVRTLEHDLDNVF